MEIMFKNKSMLTGIVHQMFIDIGNRDEEWFKNQIGKWQAGMNIQEAFPFLSPDARGFIKTGITPEEWDRYMSEEDDPFPHDQNP